MKRVLKNIVIFILTVEARFVLEKYKPKIIGITGNAGKTGTKDAVAAVMSADFFVWKNEKSYNSDLGIPLTILHAKNAWSNPVSWLKIIMEGLVLLLFPHKYPEWLVLEVGADKPDDIGKFTKWLHPEIVIVTRIGDTPVHVENFASRQGIIKEKAKLVGALKHGGSLILNADDPDVLAMKDIPKLARTITYGFADSAIMRASNYRVIDYGTAFKVDYAGNIIPVRIGGVVGRQNIYSVLAAFAVGAILNINFVSMLESVANYERPAGRLRMIAGAKGSVILDDSYNSSPAALELAIESVGDIKSLGRKIAVLGDMLELGSHTIDMHIKIGRKIPELFDMLVTVGQRAENFAEGALAAGMDRGHILIFSDSVSAGDYLNQVIKAGDLILVKGSQGVRMERVIERIMANPENKVDLLVRQDKEWLVR